MNRPCFVVKNIFPAILPIRQLKLYLSSKNRGWVLHSALQPVSAFAKQVPSVLSSPQRIFRFRSPYCSVIRKPIGNYAGYKKFDQCKAGLRPAKRLWAWHSLNFLMNCNQANQWRFLLRNTGFHITGIMFLGARIFKQIIKNTFSRLLKSFYGLTVTGEDASYVCSYQTEYLK